MNELLAFLTPGSECRTVYLHSPRDSVLLEVRYAFADGRVEHQTRVGKRSQLDKMAASILRALRPEATA